MTDDLYTHIFNDCLHSEMSVHILDLPVEVLVKIFSYVSPRGVILDLSLVCKHFLEVVQSEWYWKTRYRYEVGSQPLMRPPSVSLGTWQAGCLQAEFARRANHLDRSILSGATGGIDCVHIMHPELSGASAVIAAGSRDHSVYLWRRRTGVEKGGRSSRAFSRTRMTEHNGWVWSLTSDPSKPHLCSGAWDKSVKVWDVCVAKEIANIAKVHRAAVLSLHMPQPSVLISGCYDKQVREFDLRVPISVISNHQKHTKPVLCLAATEHYIYSGSEDKTVCVWDRRAQQQLQKIKYKSLVVSLHCDSNVLTTATGQVIDIYDCSTGTLKQHTCFTPNHSQPLTSVYHNLGMIATASKDGMVRIHSSEANPRLMANIDHHTNAVTRIDFSRNTLALASSDRNVSLWTANFCA